jgi:6-phosphogluconolactonase
VAPLVEVLATPDLAIARAESWLAARIQSGARSIGLAGGSTPKKVYEALGQQADLPWAELAFFFGDERCVPADDPDSNYRMALAALGAGGHLKPDSLHRMNGESADRDAAARAYEAILPASLDVLFLGVGEDGHTASLFPAGDAVRETRRRVMPVFGAKPPPWRLTVTPPVLAAAKALLVLTTGAGKAGAVERALRTQASPTEVPSRLLARDNATWLLDRAAAGA